MRLVSSLLILCVLGACRGRGLQPSEGFIEAPGGRVWYRIVGGGTRTPLLLVHGGPGMPSYYLKPLAALADERPVIFYDQLGAGRSDRPEDPKLWTLERFVEELAQVREALGLGEVHILGHSWGTMLTVEYMLTKNPTGVKSLVLASPALSVKRWLRDADSLKGTLAASVRKAIDRHEATRTYDAPEYQAAVMEYYKRFLSRMDPWSPDLDSTFATLGVGPYMTMWGPSEFTATGPLRDYERAERLGELKLPVLFTVGRYDEATPATVEHYASQVPGAKLVLLARSAHMTMLDEPDRYVRVVREFLREVESR
jgi:proline iminopeptidase